MERNYRTIILKINTKNPEKYINLYVTQHTPARNGNRVIKNLGVLIRLLQSTIFHWQRHRHIVIALIVFD